LYNLYNKRPMAFLKLYTGKLFEFVLSYSQRQFTRLEPALRKSQSLPCFSTGVVFVFLVACMVLLFPNFTNAQTTITKSITAGSDDAEENGTNGILPAPGFVNLTSPDIELVRDEQTLSSGDQIIGLRFTGMTIPQGATITNAYLTFRAITPDLLNILSGPASLTIKGEAVDNATTFISSGNNFNISSRS